MSLAKPKRQRDEREFLPSYIRENEKEFRDLWYPTWSTLRDGEVAVVGMFQRPFRIVNNVQLLDMYYRLFSAEKQAWKMGAFKVVLVSRARGKSKVDFKYVSK